MAAPVSRCILTGFPDADTELDLTFVNPGGDISQSVKVSKAATDPSAIEAIGAAVKAYLASPQGAGSKLVLDAAGAPAIVLEALKTIAPWELAAPADVSAESGAEEAAGPALAPGAAEGIPPSLLWALQEYARKYVQVDEQAAAEFRNVIDHPAAGAGTLQCARDAVNRGRACRRDFDALVETARRLGPGAGAVVDALAAFTSRYPHLRGMAADKVQHARSRDERFAEQARARARGLPLSSVRPGARSHRLQDQQPSPSWTVLVDETGKFEEEAGRRVPRGKVVCIAVPSTCALQELPERWHATDQPDTEIDRVVQTVLDAPVGIFGVDTLALPARHGERWLMAVLESVHWVARLLPLGKGRCNVQFLVEQRGEHKQTEWQAAVAEVNRHLAESNPQRYAQLGIHVRLVAKSDRHIGYADALAFTWNQGNPASDERCRKSGLLGGCLQKGDALELRKAWDLVRHGTRITGAQWQALVGIDGTSVAGGIAHGLLRQLNDECKRDKALWERFAEATRRHLDSKAVHLARLGREVEWLSAAAPSAPSWSPLMRLAWLTAVLEGDNHLGVTSQELDGELERLSTRLFDEEPQLVCHADLDRAVRATNRFDFAGASRALHRWKDQPPAVPGLQFWGRVQSSLGQHAAFAGDWPQAETRFMSALDAFARLADPDVGRAESRQTRAYRAIAAMDNPGAPVEFVRACVSMLAPLEAKSIDAVAASADPATKYVHHVLLRYLVQHGLPEERAAYLSARPGWSAGYGHPWPLIIAYRALLLADTDRDAAGDLLVEACDLAFADEQGPTVQLIGCVLAVLAKAVGRQYPVAAADWERLQRAMPAAPVDKVLAAMEAGVPDALAFLRETLPFNFR